MASQASAVAATMLSSLLSKLPLLSPAPLLTRIIRVDHSGELGADRIYAGQMAVLAKSSSAPLIAHMWEQEKEHLDEMERQCARNDVAPSLLAPIFTVAGYTLGAGSALLGKEGAMACTEAVEELIGQHYNEQIRELIEDGEEKHREFLKVLTKMRDEELEHLETAIGNDAEKAPMHAALKSVVQNGCRVAIWAAERV